MGSVKRRLRPVLCALALCLAPGAATFGVGGDTDWPQFRGPRRDGTSGMRGLPVNWPPDGPPVLWRRPIGAGFSEVVIAGDRVFVLMAGDESEYAVALAEPDGRELWKTRIGPLFTDHFGDGPRSTPIFRDGALFTLSSHGILHALRARNGKPIWSVDLVKEFGATVPQRGFAASPLMVDDLLLVEAGGTGDRAFVALDRTTGALRWSAERGAAGYSSGIVVTIDGVRQIVFARSTTQEIIALLPDGKRHWRFPWNAGPISTPLFVPPDQIFASASQDSGHVLYRRFGGRDTVGAILLEIGGHSGDGSGPQAREVWSSRFMKNHFGSSLLIGDHIYGFDNATLRCISAATGARAWSQRGLGEGTLTTAEGMIYLLSEDGAMVLIEATPEEYRERARFQALNGRSWTAPALANGRLYLRNREELVCIDLRGLDAKPRRGKHTGRP